VPVPTLRLALLLAAGAALAPLAAFEPGALAVALALDVGLLALAAADARRAPGSAALRAVREVRAPLTAFAPNRITVRVASRCPRPLALEAADAPPPGFETSGHRGRLQLPALGEAVLAYDAVPRARGRVSFGDLHLRVPGPLGLAAREVRLPLAAAVDVYPDLAAGAASGEPRDAGSRRARAGSEGREFAALRAYVPGDDVRAVDWKATARRGAPVVRAFQPERNQTVWLLLDCGRHLSARHAGGRTALDHAVEAALALARTAASRGDRAGAILFGAEVRRVVAPEGARARLAPLAEALASAEVRLEESDPGAAFQVLARRQRRRALVVLFTDLFDPDAVSLLAARAAALRRHLVLVAAVDDPELSAAAAARPRDLDGALARVAAERLLEEREHAARRLAAAGLRVARVPARALAAAVLESYLSVKARGEL
jgi:uncharacterized protein (DUF58 family)